MGEMQVDGKLGTLTVPGHLDGVYAAGNGKRILAKILDGVIGGVLYMGISYIGFAMLYQGSMAGLHLMYIIPLLYVIVVLVLLLKSGQTPGGKLAGLRMVRFDNGHQAGAAALGKQLLVGGISTVSFGIAPLIMWFTTQDEANRHWFDRTCGVLTIDLRQGRDCADRDSYTGFVPTSQSGLEAPSLGGSDLRDKESLPPLPPEYKASTLAPPLPPLPASNSSLPPLPPQPTSLPSAAPLPSSSSSTPPFASAAVPTSPVPPLASEHVPPLPPLPATPPLPSAPPLPADPIAAGTLPPADGFIDEVPWRKPEFSSPAPTPESSIVPPLDLHEESHLDQTVVSPRNIPVTLVFDDGTSYVLEQGAVVGRDPQCDSFHQGAIRLQVDDPSLSVSKTHMALALKAGAVLVEDLYSTNGTQVTTPEGETSDVLPGSPIIVARGALIHFGDRSVRVSE